MKIWLCTILVALTGCGASSGHAVPARGGLGISTTTTGPVLVPPEKFDELRSVMNRREPAISRCFANTILAGQLPNNAQGTISLSVTVASNGDPGPVEVLSSSTLHSKELEACVVAEIGKARFPTLPTPVTFGHTYRLERDY